VSQPILLVRGFPQMSLASPSMGFTEDEWLMLETVREFARNELLPLDRKCDKDESSMVEVHPKLAEMGLLNLCVPESLNGLGCSFRFYAAMIHELSYASPSTAVTVSVHTLTGNILQNNAKEPLRSDLMSGWGAAENLGVFVLSEAEAGSDAGAAKAGATEVDGGFRINGEKMWITNGLTGRWLLTLVRLDGSPEKEGLCAVLVDGQSEGIERTPIHGKMGIRGSETAVLHFNDVFVPESHLVGERSAGLKVMLSGLNEGRIGIASQATGIAEACLDEMVAYAKERTQFQQPIGKFQALQEMISDTKTELEAAKLLIWQAAGKVDAGMPVPAASAKAKLLASECANRAAYRAVQVHGGTGYVNECRVEQLYRDARVTTIYEGTSEIQRVVIARELEKDGATIAAA